MLIYEFHANHNKRQQRAKLWEKSMKTNGFELERSFMQEPQFDKVLRQGFLFVKTDRIQNWSEKECRTVRECLQIMVKSTCNVAVYKWKNFVNKYLPIKKSPEKIIKIDIMH